MRIRDSIAAAALWALVLLCINNEVVGQSSTGGGIISPLSLGGDPEPEGQLVVTDGDLLEVEKPMEGTLLRGETKRLRINLPANGTEYPNILISLRTTNPDGDADVACVPGTRLTLEGLRSTHWSSNHSEGVDYIFISRKQKLYESAKILINNQDASDVPRVVFQCAVTGHSIRGSSFILEVDVNYQPVKLVEQEQAAMRQIYDKCCALNQVACPDWKARVVGASSTDMDFCHAPGSFCNADGHLVRLDLRKQGLRCDFPISETANLKALEKLEMDGNELTGDIGEITQSLAANHEFLQFISLSNNILSGELHEESLCKLAHGPLIFVDIRENGIEGNIPACLFDENSSIKEAYLGYTKIGGQLPSIPGSSKLQVLSIESSKLTGPLDPSLGILENLVSLDLSENALSGTLPLNFGSSNKLQRLDLRENEFEGVIPAAIVTSESVNFAYFQGNLFTALADEWHSGDMTSSRLTFLNLSSNRIEGSFPEALTQSPKLLILNLKDNMLTGPLPDIRGMFPSLLRLDVKGNNLNGNIPEALAGIPFFDELVVEHILTVVDPDSNVAPMVDLSDNDFSGPIPDFLSRDKVPRAVHPMLLLGGNQLDVSCPVPPEHDHISDLVCNAAVTPGATTDQVETITRQPVDPDGHLEESGTHLTDEDIFFSAISGGANDAQPGEGSEKKEVKKSKAISLLAIIGFATLCAVAILVVAVLAVLKRRRYKRQEIDDLVGDVELGGPRRG